MESGSDYAALANITRQAMMMFRERGDLRQALALNESQLSEARVAVENYEPNKGKANAVWQLGAALIDRADLIYRELAKSRRKHLPSDRLNEIRAIFSEVDEKYPDSVSTGDPCFRRCQFGLAVGEFDDVISRATTGIEKAMGNFNRAQLHFIRGLALEKKGNMQSAVQDVQKASELLMDSSRNQDTSWQKRITEASARLETRLHQAL